MRTSRLRNDLWGGKINVMTIMNFIYTIISSTVTALIFLLGWSVTIGRKLQIIDDLKKEVEKFKSQMIMLIERVSKLEGRVDQMTNPHSPLAPTAKGVRYLQESGLAAILNDLEKHAWLIDQLKADLPEDYLDYDVESSSVHVLVGLRDDQMIRSVKNFAYEHGVTVESILAIAALWLRDDFLGISRRAYDE
jgi:hypothetical protein